MSEEKNSIGFSLNEGMAFEKITIIGVVLEFCARLFSLVRLQSIKFMKLKHKKNIVDRRDPRTAMLEGND